MGEEVVSSSVELVSSDPGDAVAIVVSPPAGGGSPIVPRPYQMTAIEQLRSHFGQGAMSALLVSPTGSGKGTIAAYILGEAATKGNDSVFIVHRREIIKDVHKRVTKTGVEAGMILAGHELTDHRIQVCSIATLVKRDIRPNAKFCVWDEAHHCTAKTYQAVRAAYPKAKHLGLTATPERRDQSALGDVFQVMVVVASPEELTQWGYLVPCAVDHPPTYLGEAIAQDPVAAYVQHAMGRRAIAFFEQVPEAREVAQRFVAAGVPAAAIDGTMPVRQREHLLELFASGDLLVITNCDVLTEGTDIPAAEVCILAKPCSLVPYLQRVGRVLRPSPETGKTRALLLDLPGNIWRHGHPSIARKFSLKGVAISLVDEGVLLTGPKRVGEALADNNQDLTRLLYDARCDTKSFVKRARERGMKGDLLVNTTVEEIDRLIGARKDNRKPTVGGPHHGIALYIPSRPPICPQCMSIVLPGVLGAAGPGCPTCGFRHMQRPDREITGDELIRTEPGEQLFLPMFDDDGDDIHA